jgi:hypothetical protein
MLSKKARSSGVNVARSPSGLASRRACAFTQAGASTNGVNLDPDPYSSAGNMSVATPHSWSTSPKIINPARRPPSHADHPRTQTTLARRPPSHARRQHPRTHGDSTLARTETAPKAPQQHPKARTAPQARRHAQQQAHTHTQPRSVRAFPGTINAQPAASTPSTSPLRFAYVFKRRVASSAKPMRLRVCNAIVNARRSFR